MSLSMLASIPGLWEILLILLVVLLLFGGKKLPELARSLGKSLRIFKDELHGAAKDSDEANAPADDDKDADKQRQAPKEENGKDEDA